LAMRAGLSMSSDRCGSRFGDLDRCRGAANICGFLVRANSMVVRTRPGPGIGVTSNGLRTRRSCNSPSFRHNSPKIKWGQFRSNATLQLNRRSFCTHSTHLPTRR
jgi:hypothetical protein